MDVEEKKAIYHHHTDYIPVSYGANKGDRWLPARPAQRSHISGSSGGGGLAEDGGGRVTVGQKARKKPGLSGLE